MRLTARICRWLADRAVVRDLRRHEGRRWCVSIRLEGRPYIERYVIWRGRRVTAFLHEYRGEDGDRKVHNHPWAWAVGIPLVGGYDEERLVHLCPVRGWRLVLRRIKRFRINLIRSTDFHRVAIVEPGTWTLFLHGPRIGGWGFLSEDPISSHQSGSFCYVFGQDDEEILEFARRKVEGL